MHDLDEMFASQIPGSRTETLFPFGLLVHAPAVTLNELPRSALRHSLAKYRVIVVRGLTLESDKDRFSEYCSGWGQLLHWEFGTVFEVKQHAEASNYLFTSGSVPYHWDGAFADQVPHLQLFQCIQTPEDSQGGATIFCDTVKAWASVPEERKPVWRSVEIAYSTNKVAHYGGEIRARLVAEHPVTHETVLRFAEPANADTADLNTPRLVVHGLPESEEPSAFISEVTRLLYQPSLVYAHSWQVGDHVIADNHALLHGRYAYSQQGSRCLWRVHVL